MSACLHVSLRVPLLSSHSQRHWFYSKKTQKEKKNVRKYTSLKLLTSLCNLMCNNVYQWEEGKVTCKNIHSFFFFFLLPRLFYRSPEWYNLMNRAITLTTICKVITWITDCFQYIKKSNSNGFAKGKKRSTANRLKFFSFRWNYFSSWW